MPANRPRPRHQEPKPRQSVSSICYAKEPWTEPLKEIRANAIFSDSLSADPSRERRRLAVELVATARLVTDARIRTTILALGEKWLDLADGHRQSFDRKQGLRALQMEIGQQLLGSLDLPEELSRRLRVLLAQLNDQPDVDTHSPQQPRASSNGCDQSPSSSFFPLGSTC
jgi:hypothetical protein